MADGNITIDTILSTDKFDRQISSLEKKMKKEEEKKIRKEVEIQGLEKQIADYDRAKQKVKEYEQELKKLENQKALGPEQYMEAFTKISEITQDLAEQKKIEQSLGRNYDTNKAKLELVKKEYEDITQQATEYRSQIEATRLQKQAAEVDKMKQGFNGVSNSLQQAVSRASRLALSIFGIRSAYMMLRRASSDLASYDEQYATNLEYIRFVLTQAIAPVLQWIVSLAMQLLQIIGMIVNALFGVNIFSGGSAENFKKMKAGASGVGKAVKEIKKQLMGFDEVNILSADGSTGGGGGAGGGMPDFDISKFEGDVPEWLKWIVNYKDEILAFLAGLAAYLLAIEFGLSAIKALGIGLMVAGIVLAVEGLIGYLNDPTWKNFGKIVQGIGLALLGLAVIIGSVPLAVIAAGILIVGTIIKYWDQIKEYLWNGISWLESKTDWIREHIGESTAKLYENFIDTAKKIINWFDTIFTSAKGVLDGIIQFVTGVFTGDWEKAWNGVKQIFTNIWNAIYGTFTTFMGIISNVVFSIGQTVGDIIGGAFKLVVNAVIGAAERILNTPIRKINSVIGVINNIPGVSLTTLPTISLPRMKTGGIINMPNRGTYVGGAIGGESGREGVIPLTDQQAMAELGREIGKNVLINLTNITEMNGRVISRQLKQVQATQDFAYNT